MVHHRTAKESKIPKESFIIENGQVWEFDGEEAKVLEEMIPTGRRWVFREFDGTLDDQAVRERRAAARAGVVVVDCLVKKRGAELAAQPTVTLKGFLCSEKRAVELQAEIVRLTEGAFTGWYAENPEGLTREQAVGAVARKVVKRALDLKPLVVVNFLNT
jgi:mRNA degradation ribonuclease J1/J2